MRELLKKTIKSHFLPYKPLLKSKEKWDEEYTQGKWEYLNNVRDGIRYSIIVDYIHNYFNDSASILDLGCGSGILQKKLSGNYSIYTGVDISDSAIKSANHRKDYKTKFHSEDLEKFTPDRGYNCILFNESLYYFKDPLQLIESYKPFLNNEGIFAISMWDYKQRNNKLWKSISSVLNKIEGVYLRFDSGNSWYIRFYRKLLSIALIIESSILESFYFLPDSIILI
jgi:2-polyprenyl-3-methyl-5-hydroxy-6-metoxy-1,4-benzoquinol methylase